MKILALEFSSSQRSVAVADGDGAMIEVVETSVRETHAFGMIDSALREAGLEREQIECIVVGLGPGSYHGIRVALSIAQGWQLARGIKLIGISSVETIAVQAQTEKIFGRVTAVIDAQRNELYFATFEITASERKEIEPLRIVSREAISSTARGDARPTIFVGPDLTRWFPSGKIIFPRAATLAGLAANRSDFVVGEKLEPIYLRETNFVKAPPSRIIG